METDIHDWGVTHPYICLVYRLKNIDPDDAYSSGSEVFLIYRRKEKVFFNLVQYFKGATFLWHLEKILFVPNRILIIFCVRISINLVIKF